MVLKRMALALVILSAFYATIACGETYRCLNKKGQFEFTNRPCSSGGDLVSAPKQASQISIRSDGAFCPMFLSSQPQLSGINDSRALQLDQLEAQLYMDARTGRISWVQLVDHFYARCAELYRGYRNEDNREFSAYQRVLAEKMDYRSINESEWIFLQEKQLSESRARRQIIENTRLR